MALTKKKIETFKVVLKSPENSILFKNLITSEEIKEKEHRVKNKDVTLNILVNGRDTIIGLIETSRNHNIPPKKNRKTKKISKLGFEDGDGLAYGNVFIYEKKRNLLMYEVNKFGCFVDHFVEYLYKCCKKSENFKVLDISLQPVLNSNEYQRMLKMKFYKSLELEIANPKEIITSDKHKNDALFNLCSTGAEVGSSKLRAKFEVDARKATNGLTSKSMKELIDSALAVFRGSNGDNIRKIKVQGYESDSEDNKLQPIDLIADRFLRYIELDEPRENDDLLPEQRKKVIKILYESCITDFDTIFGK